MTEDEGLMSDTKPSRFCVTCIEPGCSNHIHYTEEDFEVPLYCDKHRTKEGRHSRTRNLKWHVKKPEVLEEPAVILRCINATCHHRITVLRSDWLRNGVAIKLLCPKCGGKMLYHKDASPPGQQGV